jgi:cell division protein FtsA
MSATRLEVGVHIVTAGSTSIQNITKCAQRCQLDVQEIVLEQLASSYAVLSADEKEMGVAIVDIGGGTTDIAVFCRGALIHSSVISIGGHHFTNDIAIGLRTPQENAEELKKKYGCARAKMIGNDEVIEVPSIGAKTERILRRQILGDILQPRVEEVFELVERELKHLRANELLAAGVVLTGGSSLLTGICEMAEDILGLPVRLGTPNQPGPLMENVSSPIFATALGLAHYASWRKKQRDYLDYDSNLYTKVRKRMGAWLQDMI